MIKIYLFLIFLTFYFILEYIQLMSSVGLVSVVQQSDLVIRIDVSILFQVIFPIMLLHNFEQSYLCYTVGPC